MCGIAGIVVKNGQSAELFGQFRKSASLLMHRGPDHNEDIQYNNILLIHYRLSIIDLDKRSNQPYTSGDQNYITVYNGEIYNFNELKQTYRINCRTLSDTEVMLESFARKGTDVVHEWNGIFAIAILDKLKNKLVLVRDRFGVKPLYYFEDKNVFLFASEAKVIFNFLQTFQIDIEGLAQYLWYGNTISEHSIVKGVKKFTPASFMEVDLNENVTSKTSLYWKISGTVNTEYSFHEAKDRVKDLLSNAVKRQLISDVPLGVLLSGGIDSSAIVAFASKHVDKPLDTYSIEYDFNIGGISELPRAAMIARKFKTNHHELKVETRNILDTFRHLVFQYDEPFADAASIPLYLLAKDCSRDKTVILQGDGGDEIFAGYRHYNILGWLNFWKVTSKLFYKFIQNPSWYERMKRIAFLLNQKEDAYKMAYFLTEDVPYHSPFEIINGSFQNEIKHTNPFSPYIEVNEEFKKENIVQRMLYADTKIQLPHTFLEKVDKATMLCSVESRVPFLDNELTEFVLGLPSEFKIKRGEKKYLLRQSLTGLIPGEVLNGKKRGFDVPFKIWLKTSLYEFAKSCFQNLPSDTILNKGHLIKLLEQHKQNKGNHGPVLWKALILAHWLEMYQQKISYN